jgi:hypothetical protein
MSEATTPSRTPIGAILAIVGGALLIIGSFLSWAKISGGGESQVSFQELRTLLDVLIDNGQISIPVGIRLYAVIAGGVIAIVGAGMQLTATRTAADAALSPVAANEPGPTV